MANQGATSGTDEIGLAPGDELLGKYRVESILGRGGMGIVVRALHLQLGETVAIKMLRPDVVADAEASTRFLREAQAAVKLKSEHVARVTDVGKLANGSPYMVMEFLEGVDLDQMIESSGVLSPPLAVDLVLQACEAIGEAHSLGMVHRDIKPANFFVTWRSDGSPLCKVLDFGISKAPVTMELSLTRTQSVLGTPAYMSPEQMRSARTVDARSDIWSLGTVLYELLCGYRPFEAESFSEMCVKVAVNPPTPLSVEVPEGLDAVIMRCLEKDVAARYQDVAELARALLPYARDRGAGVVIAERVQRMLTRRAPSSADASSPDALAGLPLSQASSLRASANAARAAGTPAPGARTPAPLGKTPAPKTPTPTPDQRTPAPRRTTPWGAVQAPAADDAAAIASAPTAMMAPLTDDSVSFTTTAPVAPRAAAPTSDVTINERHSSRRLVVIVTAAVLTIAVVVIVAIAANGGGSAAEGTATGSGSAATVNGSGSAATVSGSGSAATVSGSGSAATVSGSGSAATVSGSGSAATVSGTAATTGAGTGTGTGSATASGSGTGSATASDAGSGAGSGSASEAGSASVAVSHQHPHTPTPPHHTSHPPHAGSGSSAKPPDDDVFGNRH